MTISAGGGNKGESGKLAKGAKRNRDVLRCGIRQLKGKD